ncbi:MAG TPA: NAD(P)/FAD-dependent oxidoreductase, partial [Burkholderiaceae bacterium]
MTGGEPVDVLVIGAGHNGLVCACYLAAAGLKVRVVERRGVVGGAAVTEEFFPGFRNSSASYTVSLLHPRIIADLRLAERGLRIVERSFPNFVPLPDGRSLRFGGDAARTRAEIARFSPRDAEQLPAYYERLGRIGALVRGWLLRAPPQLGGRFVLQDWRDLAAAARLLIEFGGLPREGRGDLLDAFTKSAGHWLDATFESEPLKAILGWDSVVGNFASPYAPGSAYVLLHHCLGEVNGKPGVWGHAIGGMGRITTLMAEEAAARGVRIELGCGVQQVLVEHGRAVGVRLGDGRELRARTVAANVNPKLLYQRLVEAAALPAEFARAIGAYRCGSGSFRVNVALSELPDFRCAPGTLPQPHHASGIVLGPSLAAMDRAWHDAVRDGYAAEPIIEMLIPSVVDDSLAPRGAHVASLFCQQFDPAPAAGWDSLKDRAVEAIFATVESYCPNFRRWLLGYKAWSPLDLERDF